ncbi:transglycosylase domain-containing protein [Rheinheimera sp. 1928-s]|uniref:transglycosylase domain-containing protein n=1 Tax=Rheinheimera sp. 1928-s TaxID=3033803 RepID=UPI0026134D00|nr:transglycosylase domain-containing protein [Rheinheimera sp. 1928-s]MDF3123695.1 transglycosylase domain-containing protein [Rheinheimera sp. 1928-s]
MEKTIFLRVLNLPLSLLVLAASITYIFISKNSRNDYLAILRALRTHKIQPDLASSILYLKLAEDHRFDYHWGFDFIAICRAIYRYKALNKIEGASTITQQFVRTCIQKYDVNIFRKLHEISLACLVSFSSKKSDIASAYLAIAYYGSGIAGPYEAMIYVNNILAPEKRDHPAALAALLKYPVPPNPSLRWRLKLINRIDHILYKLGKYG